jgi:hypothetical protein
VEVDGGVHLLQEEYDRERDAHLHALGLRVLRFTNQDVNQDLESVLGMILEACKAGMNSPTPTPIPPVSRSGWLRQNQSGSLAKYVRDLRPSA